MTVRPVVHQVDGRQQVGLEQLTLPVEEELAPLGVDVALNLSAVVLEFVEGDPGVDVLVKILHVVNLEIKRVTAVQCSVLRERGGDGSRRSDTASRSNPVIFRQFLFLFVLDLRHCHFCNSYHSLSSYTYHQCEARKMTIIKILEIAPWFPTLFSAK